MSRNSKEESGLLATLGEATRKRLAWACQTCLCFGRRELTRFSIHNACWKEGKNRVRWERLSDFNRLANTMSYVQQALSKTKPATATKIFGFQFRNKKMPRQPSSSYYTKKVCWRDKISQCWKKLQKGSKILQFSTFFDKSGLFCAKGTGGKINWTSMQRIQYCSTGNITLSDYFCDMSTKTKNMSGLKISETLFSNDSGLLIYEKPCLAIKRNFNTGWRGRPQTIPPVMAELPIERMDASKLFANVWLDFFASFTVKIGYINEKR